MQPADRRVEVIRVDGEPDVHVPVQPFADVVGHSLGACQAVGFLGGDRVHRRPGVAAQVGEAAGGDGATPADDAHPVGQRLDLVEDVAGEQHGDAVLPPLAHALLEGLLHQRVEPGRGLVEDEQVRLRGQRGDEGDLLAVALGVVPDPLRRIELEAFDQLLPALLVDAAVRRADHVEALAAGQAGPQRDIAGDVGQAPVQPRGLAPRVGAEQFDVTAGGPDQPEQDADGGGLARAVGAEEAMDLARTHREVEAVEGADLPEGLGEVLDADDGGGVTHEGSSPGAVTNAPWV